MKRVTLTNALKVLFAVYAVYCAIVGVYSLIRVPDVLSWPLSGKALLWFWAVFSLCLLPVAWGLAREKKWAWNAGIGLMLFGLVVGAFITAGVCFILLQDTFHKNPIFTAPALVRSRKNQIPGGADIVHPGAAVLPDCVRRCPDRD